MTQIKEFHPENRKFLRKYSLLIMAFFLFFTFISSKELLGQESHFFWEGFVREKNSTENVPNASIRIFSEDRVFIFAADDNGKAKINYYRPTDFDTIVVTSVGYKPCKLSCRELKQINEINLEQQVYALNEVIVKSKKGKKPRTVKLGNNTPPCYPISSYYIPWGTQAALFIKNEKVTGQIITIRYYMKDILGQEQHIRPFRVRIYNVDPNTKAPGEDLLKEQIIVSLDKKNWIEVDVSHYNIQLPPEGVFVGLEVLPVEYYISLNMVAESDVRRTLPDGTILGTGGIMIGATNRSKKSKKPYDSWANWNTRGIEDRWVKGNDRRRTEENSDYFINIIVEKRK